MHLWLWLTLSCTDGLSGDGQAAKAALAAALVDRDPKVVADAARAASAWKGEDAALDTMLGDAVANVLMRPEDGLAMLEAAPSPGQPGWTAAVGAAALRAGQVQRVQEIVAELGGPAKAVSPPLVAWMGARALRDPALSIDDLVAAAEDCALFDRRPARGRKPVDAPAPAGLIEAARALGADRVVVGRAGAPADPPPASGKGNQPCATGRLLPVALAPLSRHLVVGARCGEQRVFLDIRPQDGEAWVFGASDEGLARGWLGAAAAVAGGASSAESGRCFDPAPLPQDSPAAPPVQ